MTGKQALLMHEAAHCVGGLLAGHRVKEIRVGPRKRTPLHAGTASFDFSGEVDQFGHPVAILMGPLAEGQPAPAWPPMPSDNDDEFAAALVVSNLALTAAEYRAAVAIAAHYLDDHHVKEAIARVANAHGKKGSLKDEDVRAALTPDLLAWFASPYERTAA